MTAITPKLRAGRNILLKVFLALVFVLMLIPQMSAQVKMGDNPNTIDPSSLLELESTNKGLVWTRLTSNQRDNIALPSTALTIYNTDNNCIEVNIGTPLVPNWLCLKGSSDDQVVTEFTLNGNNLTISIEGGNTTTVDLTPIIGSANTDDQTITEMTLVGTNLSITIEDGNTSSVDLASLILDDQQITNFEIVGSILTIEIEDGNTSSVDLSTYPGIQGPAGTDGKGITNTTDNGDGTFTFTYTDGTIFTTGNLTGPQGVNGLDGVDGVGIINTVDNNDGTFTFIYSDGTTYTTNDLTGPQGPAGSDGISGVDGRGITNTVDNGDGTLRLHIRMEPLLSPVI